MNPNRIPKLGQCDLLYRSKAPAEKWAWICILQPAEPHSPRDTCSFYKRNTNNTAFWCLQISVTCISN